MAEKVKYRDTLTGDSKTRYFEKLKAIDDRDPYEIAKQEWSTDPKSLAEVTYPDIVNYLVHSQSAYTLQEMKAYKSLEAYNYFVCGFVSEARHIIVGGKCVLTGKVKHSQRLNDSCLLPWVICEQDGTVTSGHCTCMAGVGEVCSHVAALLFFVEAAVRMKNSRTVTEEKSYWLPSAVQKVSYKTVAEIDFTSAKTKKRLLDDAIDGSTPSPPQNRPKKLPDVSEPTSDELSSLFRELDRCGAKSAILSLIPDYSSKFIPKALDRRYPQVLTELFETVGLSGDELNNKCESTFNDLSVTAEESRNCEVETRTQSKNKKWFSFRAGRITASKIKTVCRASVDNPPCSLIKEVCYPNGKMFSTKATDWGCQREKDALMCYSKTVCKEHNNFFFRNSGFVINPCYPYMGATPDGVACCDCCGEVLLEVKCPYSAKDSHISENFECLTVTDGKLSLKKSHAYYYQVQCQLLACEKEICDFIVWTTKDIFIERIRINHNFCDAMVDKCKQFFKLVILPELITKKYSKPLQPPPLVPKPSNPVTCTSLMAVDLLDNTRQDTDQSDTSSKVICICQKVYDEQGDSVIGCDNENCKYVWLHFKCVKLKKVPKGQWYCPDCRKLPQFSKNRGKTC